jgi:phage gp16-like protein
MPTKKQLALVHVAKAELGMTELEYRDMLSRVGVSSAKDLTDGKFETILRHLEWLGFVAKKAGYRQEAIGDRQEKPKTKKAPEISSKGNLTRKVYALMGAMNLPRAYVDAVAKRMFHVDTWIWCDAEQMHKLVAALTYRKQRIEESLAGASSYKESPGKEPGSYKKSSRALRGSYKEGGYGDGK